MSDNVPSPTSPPVVDSSGRSIYSMLEDNDDETEDDPIGNMIPHTPRSRLESATLHNDDSERYYFDEPPPRPPTESDIDLIQPFLNRQFETPRLNGLNYLNLFTYLANLFVSFGIGAWGLDGLVHTRWEISQQYHTLVTPAAYAYYIWVPIVLFEAFFTIAQLLPNYRARPIIQDGTGFFFFYTCLFQTAWTIFYAFELFILSFVSVMAALLSLASLLAKQHYSQTRNNNNYSSRRHRTEYWLFKFPFYLHCGWLILLSAVHFSLIFRHFTSNIGVQLAADIVALGVMLPAATFFLTGQPSGPDFVIPIVVIWSYIAVAIELQHAGDEMIEIYGHSTIIAVRDAAYFFAGTVGCMLIPRVVIWVAQEYCTINVVELDEASSTGLPVPLNFN